MVSRNDIASGNPSPEQKGSHNGDGAQKAEPDSELIPCIASERNARDAAWLLGEAAGLLDRMPSLELEQDLWLGVRSQADALRQIEVTVTRLGVEIVPLGDDPGSDNRLTLRHDPGNPYHLDSLSRAKATVASWLASARNAHRARSPEAEALRESLATAADLTVTAYAAARIALERASVRSTITHQPLTPRFLRSGADGTKTVHVAVAQFLSEIAPSFRVLDRNARGWPLASLIVRDSRPFDIDATMTERLLAQIPTYVIEAIAADGHSA